MNQRAQQEPQTEARGCPRCMGRPHIHLYTDANGCDFSGRCSCALGQFLRARDLENGKR